MKILKKIISGVLFITFILSFPLSTYAQGLTVPVTSAQNVKECGPGAVLGVCTPAGTLDSIGTAISKMLIRYMTTSIVDWINSGFEGNPAFLSDPGSFFVDIVDQEIGNFIYNNSDLRFLCSPFSIDVRLALAFKYSPFKRRITCTLSDVIKNTQNAVDTASVNGRSIKSFMNGGFAENGGWDTWFTMTQQPQNNVFGAYFEAETELSLRIADKQFNLTQELGQGKGFLSWRKCTPKLGTNSQASVVNTYDEEGWTTNVDGEGTADTYNPNIQQSKSTYHYFGSHNPETETCEVQTPGSVISDSLNTSLGSDLRQLELADEFDEIINALVAQLIIQVMGGNGGLRGTSGSGAGDTSSYLYGQGAELEKQQTYNNVQDAKTSIGNLITGSLTTENRYKNVYQQIFDIASSTKNQLENAQKCIQDKIDSVIVFNRRTNALIEIQTIQRILNTDVNPYIPSLAEKANSSSQNVSRLQNMNFRLQQAQTMNDVYIINNELQTMLAGQLHNSQDIQNAENEKPALEEHWRQVRVVAENASRTCQSL